MNCQDFHRMLNDGDLDLPDYQPTPELQRHLEQCAECAAEFRAQQESWLLLVAALDQEPPSSEFTARLMDTVAQTSQEEASLGTSANRWTVIAKYALAASTLIALSIGSLLSTTWWTDPRQTAERDFEQVQEFVRQLGKLDELERTFPTQEMRYVSLRSAPGESSAVGYLIYDLTSLQAHFFAQGLSLPPGKVAKIWLRDRGGRVISSAVVPVSSTGMGAVVVDLPQSLRDLGEVLVTIEANAEVTEPSSAVELRDVPGN